MAAKEPKTEAKLTVVQGVAYQTVDGAITRNYVVLGEQRIYVFGANPGDELTKSEARRLSHAPKPVEKSDDSPEE
jgi:hypothetical protein